MFISTVILSFNSAKQLERCLQQLVEALGSFGEQSEVFVVDNGSRDGSVEVITRFQKAHPALIKPIFFSTNTGTTFSRNAALSQASGRYIMVLDSDAYVSFEALDKMVRFLEAEAGVGLVAPRLVYANGNFQLSCDSFPTLVQKVRRFLFLREMEARNRDLRNAARPQEVDYAISACWMLRAQAVQAAGLLDERIFYSPEDVDYCIRIWAAGWKIVYLPDAQVVHDAQELSRGMKLSKFHFSHLKGLFYLFWKHRYFFSPATLRRRHRAKAGQN